ncbi:MAG: hypothetical protein ACLQBY_01450 [Solirubrobacteraceae bacterium]
MSLVSAQAVMLGWVVREATQVSVEADDLQFGVELVDGPYGAA